MTAPFAKRRISRSVAWRLAAGVLPAVVAIALLLGLIYYGKAGREAPRTILLVAGALTLASLVIAWLNAHYFASRIARLAQATEHATREGTRTDEFERIEQAVGDLGSALTAAEAERARTGAAGAARLRQEATMLAAVVSDAIAQLDEIRLPLHILLESRFGELNENQEELLRDARNAADAIDVGLRRLGQVADADRDALPVQRELVQINDVVRSVLPLARAAAERRGARTVAALEPGLPRVVADRARLAEALTLFATDAADEAGPGAPLVISTARDGSSAVIRIGPASLRIAAVVRSAEAKAPNEDTGDGRGEGVPSLIVASRLVTAQGGEVSVREGAVALRVGGEGPGDRGGGIALQSAR